jgi:hypothetical protein
MDHITLKAPHIKAISAQAEMYNANGISSRSDSVKNSTLLRSRMEFL